MIGFSLGFAVELLVAVLLAVTIGYCVLVNRKLESLRSDQSELRAIIRELHEATAKAEHAIAGLSQNAVSAEDTLGKQIERVRALDTQIKTSIGKGEALLSKLTALSRKSRETSENSPVVEQRQIRPPRHSSIGLGLANARQRRGANGADDAASGAGAKEVAA